MSNYNIFDESIPEEYKTTYELDLIQTKAMIDASNLIADAMSERNVNRSDLAKILDVNRSYITKILSGKENLTVQNIAKILHLLGREYIQTFQIHKTNESSCNVYNFEDYTKNSSPINCHASISEGSTINWMEEVSNG